MLYQIELLPPQITIIAIAAGVRRRKADVKALGGVTITQELEMRVTCGP
jgi:hypothetical protein